MRSDSWLGAADKHLEPPVRHQKLDRALSFPTVTGEHMKSSQRAGDSSTLLSKWPEVVTSW